MLYDYIKAKSLANYLRFSVEQVREAVMIDEQYHRHFSLLKKVKTLEQALNFLKKVRYDPDRAIETKLIIKKIYQLWADSDQATTEKDGG